MKLMGIVICILKAPEVVGTLVIYRMTAKVLALSSIESHENDYRKSSVKTELFLIEPNNLIARQRHWERAGLERFCHSIDSVQLCDIINL